MNLDIYLTMEDTEQLDEVLKSPAKWKVTKSHPSYFVAEFVLPALPGAELAGDEIPFRFTATDPWDNNEWNVSFSAGHTGRIEMLKTANPFKVFATIADILKYFVKKYNPISFAWAAFAEKSRQKLYDRFAKVIKKASNYKPNIVNLEGDKVYLFTKGKLSSSGRFEKFINR